MDEKGMLGSARSAPSLCATVITASSRPQSCEMLGLSSELPLTSEEHAPLLNLHAPPCKTIIKYMEWEESMEPLAHS